MGQLKFLVITFACSIAVFGCKNDKADTMVAGKGGNASLVLFPQHHQVAKNLDSMKVYIKYNTSTLPSNGVYDDSVACTVVDSIPSGTFSGLKNGNYYLYGYGYDRSVFKNVKGGIPYTITAQSSQNVNIPVSED